MDYAESIGITETTYRNVRMHYHNVFLDVITFSGRNHEAGTGVEGFGNYQDKIAVVCLMNACF